MTTLSEFPNCAWCGKPHEAEPDGTAIGYEIAAQRFDGGGTIETVDSLHNGYLCDACAQKAATAPKLLAALDQYPARCDCSSDEQHYGRIMVWYCTKVASLLEVVEGGGR